MPNRHSAPWSLIPDLGRGEYPDPVLTHPFVVSARRASEGARGVGDHTGSSWRTAPLRTARIAPATAPVRRAIWPEKRGVDGPR